MVAGLLGLIRDDGAYVFEPPPSLYFVFNPIELLNNRVNKAINADEFGAYGVDLLLAKALFEDALQDILRHGLKPIGIFGGISDKSKNYKEADFDVPAVRFHLFGDFFPCARQFTTNCFQDLGLRCVQSSYDSMPVCLGLAYCLGCPVASMSSRYYVVPRPTILPEEVRSLTINEVKLVDLTTDFYRVDKEDGKAVLKLKVYQPTMSVLRIVPAASRPLIALLMETNLLCRLPAAIKFEPLRSEFYSSAKLRAVIDWVAKTNPIHVLQAIMESTTDPNYMNYISNGIILYLGTFCPDFVEASQVFALLGLGEGIAPMRAPRRSTAEENWQRRQRPSSPMFFFQTAARLLRGAGSVDHPVDFLYRWPTALVHLYRFHMLQKLFIAPLYSKFGSILTYENYYLVEMPCVYGPSRMLRYMHYCLIMGVEESNGLTSKLMGLRPHAKEICYEGHFIFKTYMMEVRPMHLPRSCSADDFIYAFIGLDPIPDVPDWSIALVLSCLLWHQQKVGHQDCDIAACPLILSVLVLAVVTHYNVECGELSAAIVAKHYDGLKALAVSRMEESGASVSPAVEKELMHGALELMVIYDHYVSLSRLLAALGEGDGVPDFSSAVYKRFPPNYEMFPSLALLVSMSAQLRCESAPSFVALRFWVVNVFLRTLNDDEDERRLKNVVTVFSTVLKFVSKVKLNFTAPKVDVSDPPSYFLPKDARSRAKSYGCGPENEGALNRGGNGAAALMRNSGQRRSSQDSRMRCECRSRVGSYSTRSAERVEEI